MESWISARVVARKDWAEHRVTLRLDTVLFDFRPGQFARLALDRNGERISRIYSIASVPGEPLEFFISQVPDGSLSPLLHGLVPGTEVFVREQAGGTFVLDLVPGARTLWMIATGAGLAPYVSMLRSEEPWAKFEHVVVVHGVRYEQDLAYRAELIGRAAQRAGRLTLVPVISRPPKATHALRGRVTGALRDGALERAAGCVMTPESSQVLLCGNPDMIRDMRALLGERGLRRHRRREPGHVTSEAFW